MNHKKPKGRAYAARNPIHPTMIGLFLLGLFLSACIPQPNPTPTPWPTPTALPKTPTPRPGGGANTYHPLDFYRPQVHGPEAIYRQDYCQGCHGVDLTGGVVGISCDTCHNQSWRRDCIFCHGGEADISGAPPQYLDGTSIRAPDKFSSHTAHISAENHQAYDCIECHTKPQDILDDGHWLNQDDSPGIAEVIFDEGLSYAGHYESTGCTNTYCHGDGQSDIGAITIDEKSLSCGACHADPTGPSDTWQTLSGAHARHLNGSAVCADCHNDNINYKSELTAPSHHVDGIKDIAFATTIEYQNQGCTGTCHGVSHDAKPWFY